MKRPGISTIACACVAVLMLAACGGNGNGSAVPGAGSGMQGVSSHVRGAAVLDLSGEYAGKINDSEYGKGKGTAFYAQYGSAVGGVFDLTFKEANLSASISQTISGDNVVGNSDGGSGSLYCAGTQKATYDTTTHILSGSYQTVVGCTGEKGTFALKHQCYFKGSGGADVRPEAGVMPC